MIILQIIDENTIVFNDELLELKEHDRKGRCNKCVFWNLGDTCDFIPCRAEERKDGKNVVFCQKEE